MSQALHSLREREITGNWTVTHFDSFILLVNLNITPEDDDDAVAPIMTIKLLKKLRPVNVWCLCSGSGSGSGKVGITCTGRTHFLSFKVIICGWRRRSHAVFHSEERLI